MIFVFGSNLAGRHGRGAALYAVQYKGAKYGQGVGRQGDSYAIPTKDMYIRTLPLATIEQYVRDFIKYASDSDEEFQITPIGCGLAGYSYEEIAPFFADAPDNCILPDEFLNVLEGPEPDDNVSEEQEWLDYDRDC
jgi:hypothetical protein